MPLLRASDALPRRPSRVLVAGTSGAGKTTVARRIADTLAVPRTELDALFHGPGWTPLASFVTDVEAFSSQPEWVTEWQYDAVRGLLLDRADTLVWLDLPRRLVMWRVVARTVGRRIRRQQLWNGNLEPPFAAFFTDREHVVRWAWTSHAWTAPRIGAALSSHPELVVVRLRSPAELERWVRGPLTASARAGRPGG